jgi:hypothetical protein
VVDFNVRFAPDGNVCHEFTTTKEVEMKRLKYVGLTVLSLSTLIMLAAPAGPGRNGADDPPGDDNGGNCMENVRGDGTVIVGEGRKRAQFHVRAGTNNATASGRLDFRDRSTGTRLRSTDLQSYEVVDTETRRLTFGLGGGDDTNAVNTAVVTLRDIGRRGRTDFFEIQSGDYLASGNLRNGQVRLRHRGHGCDDSTAQ